MNEAEKWGTRIAERRKVIIRELKSLRSLVGVSQRDRVRNEEMHRRTGIEMTLARRVDLRVLKWFGQVERM